MPTSLLLHPFSPRCYCIPTLPHYHRPAADMEQLTAIIQDHNINPHFCMLVGELVSMESRRGPELRMASTHEAE